MLKQLATSGGTVLSGGTDLLATLSTEHLRRPFVDISAVSGMAGITIAENHVRIGGMTRWRDISDAALPPAFNGLKAAARTIGPIQVQNRGTIGGNLCTASPAADGVPPLLSLGAEVELLSLAGMRRLPLQEFILGSRKTALRQDEILSAVLIETPPTTSSSSFIKFGGRRDAAISMVMVAVHIQWSPDDKVDEAGIAVGAASEVAQRLTGLEARLRGTHRSEVSKTVAFPEDIDGLTPVTDIRATSEFRLHAARLLIGCALANASEAHIHV